MAIYKLKIKLNGKCEMLIEASTPKLIQKEFEHYMAHIALGNQNLKSISQTFKMGLNEANCDEVSCNEANCTEPDCTVETPKVIQNDIETPAAESYEANSNDSSYEDIPTIEFNDITSIDTREDDAVLSDEAFCQGEVLDEEVYKKTDDKELSQILCDDYGFTDNDIKTTNEEKKVITLAEYMENAIANTPIDEFIVTACYLSEIENTDKFTLKFLNSKLYPVTRTLINHNVIELAKSRVLIEANDTENATEYKITDNAWNVYNYDLKRS